MIETRLFEVRDKATCIPVMATVVRPGGKRPDMWSIPPGYHDTEPNYEAENWLLRRAGWGEGQEGVYLRPLSPDAGHRYAVGQVGAPILHTTHNLDDRTFLTAFTYIAEHWHELTSGQVIDVRVILGEETEPAKSDRFYQYEEDPRPTVVFENEDGSSLIFTPVEAQENEDGS
jgi:hypothetical protein